MAVGSDGGFKLLFKGTVCCKTCKKKFCCCFLECIAVQFHYFHAVNINWWTISGFTIRKKNNFNVYSVRKLHPNQKHDRLCVSDWSGMVPSLLPVQNSSSWHNMWQCKQQWITLGSLKVIKCAYCGQLNSTVARSMYTFYWCLVKSDKLHIYVSHLWILQVLLCNLFKPGLPK